MVDVVCYQGFEHPRLGGVNRSCMEERKYSSLLASLVTAGAHWR